MAKVEVVESTASDKYKLYTYTDRNGHAVTIKRPRKIQEVAVMELVGEIPKLAYLHYWSLLWIVTIDGVECNFSTKNQMSAVIDRLDDGVDDLIAEIEKISGNSAQGEVQAAKK